MLLVLPALGHVKRRYVAGLAAMWLICLLVFADSPQSLLRFGSGPSAHWRSARQSGRSFRVVSLNCDTGSMAAAEEVARFEPDLVLLQESPNRTQVEQLAKQLFGNDGAALCGPDASIIVRGTIWPRRIPAELNGYCVHAQVELASGIETEVISLRLVPGLVRLDLWSLECWCEQQANRRRRREQLRAVARQIQALPDQPLIVGGDFNAPPGDAVFRQLRPRLRDAFAQGGRGWGNTMVNAFPVLRIDQVWISDHFRADAVSAQRTENSDHRMVVCDLVAQ